VAVMFLVPFYDEQLANLLPELWGLKQQS